MTLGDWLEKQRAAKGLRIREAAAECGVGRAAWAAWEAGTARPGVYRAAGIARALGVPVEEVYARLSGVRS